jgi:hypothetical protein
VGTLELFERAVTITLNGHGEVWIEAKRDANSKVARRALNGRQHESLSGLWVLVRNSKPFGLKPIAGFAFTVRVPAVRGS